MFNLFNLKISFFINNICLCFFRFQTKLVKALVNVGAFLKKKVNILI